MISEQEKNDLLRAAYIILRAHGNEDQGTRYLLGGRTERDVGRFGTARLESLETRELALATADQGISDDETIVEQEDPNVPVHQARYQRGVLQGPSIATTSGRRRRAFVASEPCHRCQAESVHICEHNATGRLQAHCGIHQNVACGEEYGRMPNSFSLNTNDYNGYRLERQ